MSALDDLARSILAPDGYPLFVTGAGISLASGIPTFRGSDPGAIWAEDVLEMGTAAHFRRDPVAHWAWYLKRFAACRSALPNPAHEAITRIERAVIGRGDRFCVVTQNIDGLHVLAGTKNVIQIHGDARKLRCSRQGCPNGAPRGSMPWDDALFDAFRESPTVENLPRCANCGKLLRPHVLYFDEYYTEHADYRFRDAQNALAEATLVVFVGTSFSVGITESALDAILARRLPCWIVDPHLPDTPIRDAHPIRSPAELALPELADLVRP